MKYALYALFSVLFISCNSDDESTKDYTAENEQEIIEYITQHNLDAVRTNSGLYYVIDELGSGDEIIVTSDISVKFKGTLTNGTVFEDTEDNIVSFNLSQVIAGWTEGIQYFKKGGKGKLFVPSHLAYGVYDYNGIPGGSVLIFDVELVSFME